MTLEITTYDDKTKILENVIGFNFDGETGKLNYNDNVSMYKSRIEYRVKEVHTL